MTWTFCSGSLKKLIMDVCRGSISDSEIKQNHKLDPKLMNLMKCDVFRTICNISG